MDDVWQQIAAMFEHPGPTADCGYGELVTMALVGECREGDQETTMLSRCREHQNLWQDFMHMSALTCAAYTESLCLSSKMFVVLSDALSRASDSWYN